MSKNAPILQNAAAPKSDPIPVRGSGDYLDIIRGPLRSHAVLAVVGSAPGTRVTKACSGMAADLAATGHRVVIVDAGMISGLESETSSSTQAADVPNVWRWPAAAARDVEFFPTTVPPVPVVNWLVELRRRYDFILLECGDSSAWVFDVAAKAEAAVLVVESGITGKQQVRFTQRALELRGMNVAGCVLMKRR